MFYIQPQKHRQQKQNKQIDCIKLKTKTKIKNSAQQTIKTKKGSHKIGENLANSVYFIKA
jgi:hypothetical protein